MDGHPDSLFVMDMNPQLCVTSQLMTHFEYDCMIEVGQQVLSFENVATTQEGPPAVKQWTELKSKGQRKEDRILEDKNTPQCLHGYNH